MAKIKLAIIGLRGFPASFPGSSGIDTYIENVYPHLLTKFSPTLFCRSWTKSSSPQCFNLPCLNSRYFDTIPYSIFATVVAILKRYPVIWFHAPSSCLLLPLARISGSYLVTTFHGIDWQRQKWAQPLNRLFLKFVELLAAKYSHQLTAVSLNVKRYLEKKYHHQVVYTPPGFTPRSISTTHQNYILYLGRLVPEKRINWLITSFISLKNSTDKLIISGKLDNSVYCQQLQALASTHSNIIFTNYVSGQKKRLLLQNCHLFVLPSELEGNSLSLLEALEFNRPCLISDLPNHQYLSKKFSNIHLFSTNSQTDLLQKLKTLLSSSPASTNPPPLPDWSQITSKLIPILTPQL